MIMDFSILTPIAAFGGFALGLINLGITVYKDFFRKSKLNVEILSFKTRYVEEGEYNLQLDVRFKAENGLIVIKDVKLKNKYGFTGDASSERNEIQMYRGIPMNKLDLCKLNKDCFLEKVKKLFEEVSFSITDLQIQKDEIKSITFADNIQTIMQCDGYDELPQYQWYLEISYNNELQTIPLKLEPIGDTRGCYSHQGAPYEN